MELHQLRYFVAAAEAGSITLAARRSHVAQPSLSQQVRKLEESLGVALFDRLGRGVTLTDAGRALLPRARRILAEVSHTRDQLHADIAHGAGRLAIGAIPTIAPFLLPPVLAQLRRAHPACEIIVREDLTESLVEAVVDNDLDAAITSTPIDHALIETQVLGREPLLVVTPAAHPLATHARISLADLREQATVSLHEMHCLGQQIGAFCSRAGLRPDVVCRTTQLDTVLELVRLGLGVSLIPAMAAARDAARRVAYLHLARSQPTREIAIIWRTGRSRTGVARALPDLVTRQLRTLLARTP